MRRITSHSTAKAKLCLALLLAFALATAYLRILADQISAAPILDMRFGYNYSEVAAYIHSLGLAGAARYQLFQTFDYLHMPIYAALAIACLSWASQYAGNHRRRLIWCCAIMLPVVVLADLVEDTAIGFMLRHPNAINQKLVAISSAATISKIVFAGLLAVCLLLTIIRARKAAAQA